VVIVCLKALDKNPKEETGLIAGEINALLPGI